MREKKKDRAGRVADRRGGGKGGKEWKRRKDGAAIVKRVLFSNSHCIVTMKHLAGVGNFGRGAGRLKISILCEIFSSFLFSLPFFRVPRKRGEDPEE